MENSNLISLLKTFSKKEIKEFDKFLRSPYFTEGKNLRHRILYDYFLKLKDFYPAFTQKEFAKEKLYSLLYPGSIYKDGIMRKLNSDLLKLTEKFLSQMEFEKDSYKGKEYLIKNLSPRKLDKTFLKKVKEYEITLDNNPFNHYYYLNKQLLNTLVNNFCVYRQELLNRYDFQNEADNFFYYFLSRALGIYRNMNIDTTFLNIKYKPHFMKEVLDYIKQNPEIIESDPLIAIHYYELMVNLSSNKTNYIKLKLLKEKYIDKLDVTDRYDLYVNLTAYCIQMLREGKTEYRRELLNIDIEILEEELLAAFEYISFSYYVQLIRNTARLKEFGWAEKFIRAYEDRLDPLHKNFAGNFAKAEVSYEQKKYNEALVYLSKITIEFSREKQQVKNMMLKIYYETESFENALSLIDSSRHFLKNDKNFPEKRKKTFTDFLVYMSQMVDIKLKPDPVKLDVFKKRLDKAEFFANKDWFLEKIDEMRNKY